MSVEVEIKGLDAMSAFFRQAPEAADRAAVLSTNDAINFARVRSSREMRDQVNWTQKYLNTPGRLSVTRKANSFDIEAVLSGRNRPTSLATFATTPPTFGRRKGNRGVRVKVARNGGDTIAGAFFVKLSGAKGGGNVGLAVRTKSGRPPRGTRGARPIFGGEAWLLYGPSIGQVAFDVFPSIADDVGDYHAEQFARQFTRLSNGG